MKILQIALVLFLCFSCNIRPEIDSLDFLNCEIKEYKDGFEITKTRYNEDGISAVSKFEYNSEDDAPRGSDRFCWLEGIGSW